MKYQSSKRVIRVCLIILAFICCLLFSCSSEADGNEGDDAVWMEAIINSNLAEKWNRTDVRIDLKNKGSNITDANIEVNENPVGWNDSLKFYAGVITPPIPGGNISITIDTEKNGSIEETPIMPGAPTTIVNTSSNAASDITINWTAPDPLPLSMIIISINSDSAYFYDELPVSAVSYVIPAYTLESSEEVAVQVISVSTISLSDESYESGSTIQLFNSDTLTFTTN